MSYIWLGDTRLRVLGDLRPFPVLALKPRWAWACWWWPVVCGELPREFTRPCDTGDFDDLRPDENRKGDHGEEAPRVTCLCLNFNT